MRTPIRLLAAAMLIIPAFFYADAGARQAADVFEPGAIKGPAKGAPSEVMVLGTAHLRGLPALDPAALGELKARLQAWKPRIIAIEQLSGTQCAMMRRYPLRYADVVATYCGAEPVAARAATGLDVPAATEEAGRLLSGWPASPTPSQRRHLAAVFLAGEEQASALVQWLRLPEA